MKMGCFSFKCKECNQPVLSDSRTGQDVKLFLLEKGEVVERMEGQYDSYGRVFVAVPKNESFKDSVQWDRDWSDVCNLMFSEDKGTGMAAVHSSCFKQVPTTKSEDDPNQGWGGEDEEWEEDEDYEGEY